MFPWVDEQDRCRHVTFLDINLCSTSCHHRAASFLGLQQHVLESLGVGWGDNAREVRALTLVSSELPFEGLFEVVREGREVGFMAANVVGGNASLACNDDWGGQG